MKPCLLFSETNLSKCVHHREKFSCLKTSDVAATFEREQYASPNINSFFIIGATISTYTVFFFLVCNSLAYQKSSHKKVQHSEKGEEEQRDTMKN